MHPIAVWRAIHLRLSHGYVRIPWWLSSKKKKKKKKIHLPSRRHGFYILGLGRSPGEGNGNPLQYSCLENPMDRGFSWWATVNGVVEELEHDWMTEQQMCVSQLSFSVWRSGALPRGHHHWKQFQGQKEKHDEDIFFWSLSY